MKITSVVMTARRATRRRAASKARSVASPKRLAARSSWAKACTVRTASSVSPPSDTMSAMRACASRDSARTLRPNRMIGATTNGTTASTNNASLGLVITSMATPPMHISMLRSATEADEPHQYVARPHGAGRADDLLDELRIGRDAAHDVARTLDLEPGRTQPDDMGEQVAAQVADHAFAQPRDQVEARARGDRQNHRHDQQRGQRIVQDTGSSLGEAALDQGAQAGAEGQHGAGRHQE